MSLTGQNSWEDLAGEVNNDFLGNSFVATINIVEGSRYDFRIRAANKWGFGEFSDLTTILAATVPAQVDQASTSVVSLTGDVKVDWNLPSSRGSEITRYDVEFLTQAAAWLESSYCDGQESSILLTQTCQVPMSEFSGAFGLIQGDLIQVRIKAVNILGTGSPSVVNIIGARVRTVPKQMTAPQLGSDITETQLQLFWTPLAGTDTGDSAITAYELFWDAQSGTTSILLTSQEETSFTQTSL